MLLPFVIRLVNFHLDVGRIDQRHGTVGLGLFAPRGPPGPRRRGASNIFARFGIAEPRVLAVGEVIVGVSLVGEFNGGGGDFFPAALRIFL